MRGPVPPVLGFPLTLRNQLLGGSRRQNLSLVRHYMDALPDGYGAASPTLSPLRRRRSSIRFFEAHSSRSALIRTALRLHHKASTRTEEPLSTVSPAVVKGCTVRSCSETGLRLPPAFTLSHSSTSFSSISKRNNSPLYRPSFTSPTLLAVTLLLQPQTPPHLKHPGQSRFFSHEPRHIIAKALYSRLHCFPSRSRCRLFFLPSPQTALRTRLDSGQTLEPSSWPRKQSSTTPLVYVLPRINHIVWLPALCATTQTQS